MLKIRNMSVVLGVVLALFCTAALAQAPTFESDPRTGRQVMHRDVNPLDVPTAFSQNTSLDLVPFSGVACVAPGFITTENAWWRYYKLSETEVEPGFFLSGDVCVKSVDYGVAMADDGRDLNGGVPLGPLDENIRVGCLPLDAPQPDPPPAGIGVIPIALVNIVGDVTRNAVGDGQNFIPQTASVDEFRTITVDGCCNAETEGMAIGIGSPQDCTEDNYGPGGPGDPQDGFIDCLAYLGSFNQLGQSGPTFIEAENCGAVDPLNLAFAGFPNNAIVQLVHATTAEPLPASTALGMLLMIVVFLGSSTYFLRRQALNN